MEQEARHDGPAFRTNDRERQRDEQERGPDPRIQVVCREAERDDDTDADGAMAFRQARMERAAKEELFDERGEPDHQHDERGPIEGALRAQPTNPLEELVLRCWRNSFHERLNDAGRTMQEDPERERGEDDRNGLGSPQAEERRSARASSPQRATHQALTGNRIEDDLYGSRDGEVLRRTRGERAEQIDGDDEREGEQHRPRDGVEVGKPVLPREPHRRWRAPPRGNYRPRRCGGTPRLVTVSVANSGRVSK